MKVHHQGNRSFKLTQLYLFPPFTNRLRFGSSMYFIVTLQVILLPVVKSFDLPFLELTMLRVLELFEMHSFHLCNFTCFCTCSSVHTWHQLKIIFKELTQDYSVWLFTGVWFLCCHCWPVLSEMNGSFNDGFLIGWYKKRQCSEWAIWPWALRSLLMSVQRIWLP